jgi:uncharacterized protein (DUF488 family)
MKNRTLIIEKLETLSFSDLCTLKQYCELKMDYHQKRFPIDKKINKHIYRQQYAEWIKYYGLHVIIMYCIDKYVENLL